MITEEFLNMIFIAFLILIIQIIMAFKFPENYLIQFLLSSLIFTILIASSNKRVELVINTTADGKAIIGRVD